jgi:hypothetical protein
MYTDFVLFFLEVGKNPLITGHEMPHSPFSYQIFAMQMKAAIMCEDNIDIKNDEHLNECN